MKDEFQYVIRNVISGTFRRSAKVFVTGHCQFENFFYRFSRLNQEAKVMLSAFVSIEKKVRFMILIATFMDSCKKKSVALE